MRAQVNGDKKEKKKHRKSDDRMRGIRARRTRCLTAYSREAEQQTTPKKKKKITECIWFVSLDA